MHEILFSIGPFTVYSWGLMLGLGVISALTLLWGLCKYFKIDEKIFNFYWWNGVVAIAFGLLGAWVFQKIYDAIAGKPFVWGGFTFMGGLVFGAASFVLGVAIFAKRPAKNEFYRIANFAAPCIVLAHGFGRIGCFLAGCCYGKHSEHGLVFPYGASTGRVLPTQLYEALYLFVLFGIMMFFIFKVKKFNFLLIAYGIAYAVFRFIIEYFRDDYRGGVEGAALSPSQWQSIILILAAGGLALLVYYFKIVPFYKPIQETANQVAPVAAESSLETLTGSQTESDESTDNSKE